MSRLPNPDIPEKNEYKVRQLVTAAYVKTHCDNYIGILTFIIDGVPFH